jgi:hypothetical protein
LIESTTAASAALALENFEVIVYCNLAGLRAFLAGKKLRRAGFSRARRGFLFVVAPLD